MKMIKSWIADFPILLSVPIQLLIKVLLKVVDGFIYVSTTLHLALDTETGKKIKAVNLKMEKIMETAEAIQAQIEKKGSAQKRSKSGSKLFDTIMGDDDDTDGKTFH